MEQEIKNKEQAFITLSKYKGKWRFEICLLGPPLNILVKGYEFDFMREAKAYAIRMCNNMNWIVIRATVSVGKVEEGE